jgi:hypothetical protein
MLAAEVPMLQPGPVDGTKRFWISRNIFSVRPSIDRLQINVDNVHLLLRMTSSPTIHDKPRLQVQVEA